MKLSCCLLCKFVLVVGLGSVLLSCRVTIPSGTLEPDLYRISDRHKQTVGNQRLYIIDTGDSLHLLTPGINERRSVARATYSKWTFQRTEIDIDVFTLPFKIRPAQRPLPAQLNSNFNAAAYIGRRVDSYTYKTTMITPSFAVRQLRRRGIGYGFFCGVGSVSINDYVTKKPIGIEYEGVSVDAGVAALYDARIFNIGLAMGVDYLMDTNRQQWIYQQRPWFGVLFGLNLN